MSPLHSLARPEILTLKPYSHAAWLPSLTRLHANEAPWRPAGDLTEAGLKGLGPTAQILAGLEGLDAHAAAVTIRLDALARQEQS